MKKILMSLVLAGIATSVFANNVAITNKSASKGPIVVTYQFAKMDQGQSIHFGSSRKQLLKPGESLQVNTPLSGYQYSGVVITQLKFRDEHGQLRRVDFPADSFANKRSCAFRTSATKSEGRLQLGLYLSKNHGRLTCQK